MRGGLVRKIQTPLAFKGKLKVTKKSSAMRGPKAPPAQSLLHQLVDNEDDFFFAQSKKAPPQPFNPFLHSTQPATHLPKLLS